MSSSLSGQSPNPSSSESKFRSILDAALIDYKEKTGNELLDHPLAAEVQRCDSVDVILSILQAQAKAFKQSRAVDQRLMKWIGPVVHILYTFSGALGSGVGMVRP